MKRPASITTFGVLNIVFAVLGIFGLIVSIAALFMPGAGNNPIVRLMRESPAFAAWMKISIPLGLLGCLVLLIAGIGLLRLKPWARKLSIGYSIYAIITGLLGLVMNFLFLIRPMLQEAAQRQGPEAAGAIGGAIGGGIGLIYPVLLLIFMTRPNMVAVFHPPDLPPVMPSG
jgi:hypothetical protein